MLSAAQLRAGVELDGSSYWMNETKLIAEEMLERLYRKGAVGIWNEGGRRNKKKLSYAKRSIKRLTGRAM
jgi:hypothetical protein